MKKVLQIICAVLLYIWQFPQNLVGLFMLWYYRGERRVHKENGTAFYVVPSMKGGFSMGRYIFISKNSILREPVYDHEYGHTRQSQETGLVISAYRWIVQWDSLLMLQWQGRLL